jgi:hypothetical protein
LNALIAVKDGLRLSITTTGKISGLLFRDDEFSAITETAPAGGLLKTFENFSIGKLHLGDILIFSTTQLFNNISIDRIKNILNTHTLPLAGQEILRILQDNVGPEVAFGSIMALMVEPGTTTVEQVALEDYIAPAKIHKQYALQTWHADDYGCVINAFGRQQYVLGEQHLLPTAHTLWYHWHNNHCNRSGTHGRLLAVCGAAGEWKCGGGDDEP